MDALASVRRDRKNGDSFAFGLDKERAMKTSFAALLALCLFAPAARAEWLLASQDGFSKIYLDPSSRKELPENIVSVRALTDYDPAAPEAAGFDLSQKGLSEIENVLIDCPRKSYRSEGGKWFAGPMATGDARSDYPAKSNWSPTPRFYQGLAAKICPRD
jgi:hypothetical protein